MSFSDRFKKKDVTPAKASDQAIAAIEEKLNVQAEFIPSAIKGEGQYILSVSSSYSRNNMTELGLDADTARGLDAHHLNQWRVPPEIINKVVAGGSDMTPEALTAELRKIKGLETATVRNMNSYEEGYVVMEAPSSTSRTVLVGEDGDKNQIKSYNFGQRQIIIPEKTLHTALGIQEGLRIT
jgi:hypothetical protein